MNFKKDTLKFKHIYRGKVLDNNDPDELGRIKVQVLNVLEGIEAAFLPWAIPAMSLFTGSGNGFGCFTVPEVDSYVWCFFEAGDIYQPVYFAEALSGVHGLPVERETDYPNTKVMKTKNGIVITINDKLESEEIKILHPTGAFIQIDKSGNITVSGNRIDLNP